MRNGTNQCSRIASLGTVAKVEGMKRDFQSPTRGIKPPALLVQISGWIDPATFDGMKALRLRPR
jgi:hypothetical protein